MSAFTVRLPDDVSKKLDALAAKLDRSRSYVAVQAIEDFVAREAWQLADIEAGLREAERGDFASDAEVAATIATAGHGVGNIEDIPTAAELCRRLVAQYRVAKSEMLPILRDGRCAAVSKDEVECCDAFTSP